MGRDFKNDPRYPEDEFPEGIAGNKVDKRNIKGSGGAAEKRLKARRIEGGKNFDAAESVDKANDAIARLVERGVIELVEEPEADEAE